MKEGASSFGDLEQGHHHLPSNAGITNGSSCSSDTDEPCWHSPGSTSPCDELRLSGASGAEVGVPETRRNSCASSYFLEIDLESGIHESKMSWGKDAEKVCRICHLGLRSCAEESGVAIELGCSCKGDLAAAHKQCAETWFKIKGNKTCEICGITALNVSGPGDANGIEQSSESNATAGEAAPPGEGQSFWQGRRFLNFLLACMIFAFVVSWLFHFNLRG